MIIHDQTETISGKTLVKPDDLKPLNNYKRYTPAQLGKARAMKSKKEYEKFFEMWKDADKDLPELITAKKEYAELD